MDMKEPLLNPGHQEIPTRVVEFKSTGKMGFKINGCQVVEVYQGGLACAAGVLCGWEIVHVASKQVRQSVTKVSTTEQVNKLIKQAMNGESDIFITFQTFGAQDPRAPASNVYAQFLPPVYPNPDENKTNAFLAKCDPQSISLLTNMPPQPKAVVNQMVPLLQKRAEQSIAFNHGIPFHDFISKLLHPGERVLKNIATGYHKVVFTSASSANYGQVLNELPPGCVMVTDQRLLFVVAASGRQGGLIQSGAKQYTTSFNAFDRAVFFPIDISQTQHVSLHTFQSSSVETSVFEKVTETGCFCCIERIFNWNATPIHEKIQGAREIRMGVLLPPWHKPADMFIHCTAASSVVQLCDFVREVQSLQRGQVKLVEIPAKHGLERLAAEVKPDQVNVGADIAV